MVTSIRQPKTTQNWFVVSVMLMESKICSLTLAADISERAVKALPVIISVSTTYQFSYLLIVVTQHLLCFSTQLALSFSIKQQILGSPTYR